MPALSEYAGLASGQRPPLQPPAHFGEAARWLVLFLGAYLAIRFLLGVMRWMARR